MPRMLIIIMFMSSWMCRTDWTRLTFAGANKALLARLQRPPSSDGSSLVYGHFDGRDLFSSSAEATTSHHGPRCESLLDWIHPDGFWTDWISMTATIGGIGLRHAGPGNNTNSSADLHPLHLLPASPKLPAPTGSLDYHRNYYNTPATVIIPQRSSIIVPPLASTFSESSEPNSTYIPSTSSVSFSIYETDFAS